MSTDALVAYALISIPVLLVAFVTGVGWYVVQRELTLWRRKNGEGHLPGSMWQALLFVVVIDVILLAGMDVGQFFVLWTEGWQGIVAVVATIFMPWLGYKVGKLHVSKKGEQGYGVEIDRGPPPTDSGEGRGSSGGS